LSPWRIPAASAAPPRPSACPTQPLAGGWRSGGSAGARLIERNTRRLYLTDEGRSFLARARSLLADFKDAEAALSETVLDPTGTLRVSASLSFSLQHIAPFLPDYVRLYPKVRVHVEAANRYLDLIDNGIDVAIRTREVEPDSNITIRRLAETRRILVAAPSYLEARGCPTHPNDLKGHDLLLYTYAKDPNALHFRRGRDVQTLEVNGLLESNDGQILRSAALKGLGIIVQPAYIVYDDLVAGRLMPVLDDWDLPRLTINIAYPSRKHLSAKVRSFIDFMVEQFARKRYESKWTGRFDLLVGKHPGRSLRARPVQDERHSDALLSSG
jgi:DNA-binding transcriptional LysR family regulator